MSVIDHQSEYVDDLLARLDDVIDDLGQLSLGAVSYTHLTLPTNREV